MDDRTGQDGTFEFKGSQTIRSSHLPPAVEGRHRHQGRLHSNKVQAFAGSEDRAGGVVWRARDANNYYVARANALEDNVVLYKTVEGVRSALDIVGRKGGYGVTISVPGNEWLTIRVEFKGSRFRVLYNGQRLFEVEDPTFPHAGKVGLWTKADSVTLFDEVTYGVAK